MDFQSKLFQKKLLAGLDPERGCGLSEATASLAIVCARVSNSLPRMGRGFSMAVKSTVLG